jgi:hypothetical protein
MRYKTLYEKLHSYSYRFYGEKTSNQVIYWTRRMLAEHKVKVKKYIDKTNTSYSILCVGGCYDPTIDDEKDIEMYISFNENENIFKLEESIVKVFIDEVFKTLVHEKKHRYQFRQRGNNFGKQYRSNVEDKTLKIQLEYYGDDDEIDAYAQEAVIEMRLHGKSHSKEMYQTLFAKTDPVVYNRFLKKFIKYHQKITL